MANLVLNFETPSGGKFPSGIAQIAGNYSSGPKPSVFDSCSTGQGGPVQGYNNKGDGTQFVTPIPYTCPGGNFSLTISATGYFSQSYDSGNMGYITGDVTDTIVMTPDPYGLGVGGPSGQGLGAGATTASNTGLQAFSQDFWIVGLIVGLILVVIVVLRFA